MWLEITAINRLLILETVDNTEPTDDSRQTQSYNVFRTTYKKHSVTLTCDYGTFCLLLYGLPYSTLKVEDNTKFYPIDNN